MGWWSSIKKAVKKAAKWVKRVVWGTSRWGLKLLVGALMRGINVWDTLLGFLNWPPKKLTLHIMILSKLDPIKQVVGPICTPAQLDPSINQAKRILKERFNVTLRPYLDVYVQVLEDLAPESALKPECGIGALIQDLGEAGEYYAQNTAGWVGIPTSLRFPITAFVVEDVQGEGGCAIGPLADYLVIDKSGVNEMGTVPHSLLMHEIGHVCGLWHSGADENIMNPDPSRGDETRRFQRNLLRSSRHVTYW